ncbi:ABC transporter [Bradyrhizobium brasilense]|nr:ABC transporter [Bradyrhizobium brasilense]
MPGLDPGIHRPRRILRSKQDGRVKPGHDECVSTTPSAPPS